MNRTIASKIWMTTIAIILVGLIALYSASYQNVRVPQSIFYDQLLGALVGLIFMFILSKIDYRKFYDAAYLFYGINFLMLVMVLIAGRHALGATRWLDVGPISFQPSEITKLSLILFLGRYYTDRRPTLSFNFLSRTHLLWQDILMPFGFTALLMLLIFKQPDLGTSLLLLGIFLIVSFAAGVGYRYYFGFISICVAAVPIGWRFLKPYQKDRLLVFLNPNIDPLGAGYTIIQSKIAVGSGKLFGKGWLGGTQNQLNFLPERHTDFIFSVIGEEWGLIGSMVMVGLFFYLIQLSLTIAEQVKDKFGMLVATGIVSILTLQVVINIGMVMGLFPIVGLTLPFVSYGRSSFVIFVIMMGFLLNLSKKRTVF